MDCITKLYEVLKTHKERDRYHIQHKISSELENVNITHFFKAEQQTSSTEKDLINAEYGGGSVSAPAPFLILTSFMFDTNNDIGSSL